MIQRLLALAGRLNEDRQVCLGLFLADIIVQPLRAQRVFHLRVVGRVFRRNHPGFQVNILFGIFHCFTFLPCFLFGKPLSIPRASLRKLFYLHAPEKCAYSILYCQSA